jgi:WD40 repeat protein
MEVFMPRSPDSLQHDVPSPPGVTRRRFIRRAGASAAGAVLLGGALQGAAGADEKPNAKKGDKAHTHPHRPTCVAKVTDKTVVTSDDDGNLILWTLDGSKPPQTSAAMHTAKAAFVAVSGNRAFTAGYDGIVIPHDLQHLEVASAWTFGGHRAGTAKPEVWVVTFSKNGMRALSATNDGQILLWNTTDLNTPMQAFKDNGDPVGGLAFVPAAQGDETMFLSTHGHGDINLWDIGSKKALGPGFSHGNSHQVNAVAIATDASFFISASFDMTLRVWDLPNRNPNPTKTLKGHKSWVWRVALSPSNQKAASAGEDGYVHVWDLTQPGNVLQPSQSVGPVPHGSMGIAFLDENRIVFTTGTSNPAKPPTVKQIQ